MFHLVLPDCRNPGAGKLGRNGWPNQDAARKNGGNQTVMSEPQDREKPVNLDEFEED
jgi:hypothetical protein